MIPFPEPNKTSPKSDANGHSQPGTPTIVQFPSEPNSAQQQADSDFNKPHEQDTKNAVKDQQQIKQPKFPQRKSRGLSLKTKATALAIALGTLPVIGIGAIAYYFADQAITKQINTVQQSGSIGLADKTNRFMFERYGDIQVLSNLRSFSDPTVRKITSPQQQEAQLNNFVKAYGFYDSIAVLDLNGNLIAKSSGKASKNQKARNYFQQVIKTDKPFIDNPEKSKQTGKQVIYIAAPIKDTVTGKTIAVVRTRMPIERMATVLANFSTGGNEYHLINLNNNQVFAATEKNQIGRNALSDFGSGLGQLEKQQKGTLIVTDKIDNAQQLIAYSPLEKIEGLADLNWGSLMAIDTDVAFTPQKQLLLTLMLGTGLTALLVSAIAAYLAEKATRPILAATDAVEKLGQGELDTRIAVQGKDELATLGSNINSMAGQLQNFLQFQEAEAERAQLTRDITGRISQSLTLEDVCNTAVNEIRHALKSDRVVVYSFNDKWQGTVTAESVADGWPRALGALIADPCFADRYVDRYAKGRIQATENIYEAGLTQCHLKQLEPFAVKANLVAPILANKQLIGLLIAHQCSGPRAWQQGEIDMFSQLATQVGLALDRADLLNQQKTGRETLQRRALELLMEVDPVSKGDLTIRANVTEDEIGTVADSYNSTISSLRKIVTQVQTAAQQMATTTSSNEVSVQELSGEALRQTEEITAALDRIQEMSNSIRAVATSAEQAEVAVQQATQTVEAGDVAMNRTVNGIMAIQETVTEASQRVKHLGESSQKISKVVKLISSFADQTNLLALNAAIEAARAGEEGRGFAVVADEVQSLALQSAQATAEIESLVTDIQTETIELVTAMETGTEQVAEGTRLVDETRQSLNQITAVSAQISELVQTIASAAVAQSQASESVTQSMTGVAAIANQTSTEATQVSASFKELLAVAKELQASAGQFKVN